MREGEGLDLAIIGEFHTISHRLKKESESNVVHEVARRA